jgi:transposase
MWWHTLPHRVIRGQRRKQRGASHGPYIGIDVHKKESQLCILSEDGQRREPRVRTTPARFADVLGDRPRARILLEASTESEWVTRCLERLGHEVIVANPNFAPMYATRTRKIKTDRRDARAGRGSAPQAGPTRVRAGLLLVYENAIPWRHGRHST